MRKVLALIVLNVLCMSSFAGAADGPGSRLKSLVMMDSSQLSPELFERTAQEVGGREGSLIRLLAEVITQCFGLAEACSFAPQSEYEEWKDLVLWVRDAGERANWIAMGHQFGCAHARLQGSSEGEYLDCLKQGEL